MPEPHTRTSKKISKDHQRRTFSYIYIYRERERIPQGLHSRTSYEHPRGSLIQAPIRASWRSSCKGLLKGISTGSPQDLHTRTHTRSCKDIQRISPGPPQDLFTRASTGSCKGIWQKFTRISTKSSRKDLYKITQGPLWGFRRDLYKIFSQGIVKDLDQDLHARTPKRISQDRDTTTCFCWRGSYKFLIQEPPKSIPEGFHTSTSNTWHLQDLHATTS